VLDMDVRDKTGICCTLNYLLHNEVVLEPYAISCTAKVEELNASLIKSYGGGPNC
jgi:hypothetical protein